MRKKTDRLRDPIVEEVRRAGKELEKEAGGNLHRFFELLRRTEKTCGHRVARPHRKPPSLRSGRR